MNRRLHRLAAVAAAGSAIVMIAPAPATATPAARAVSCAYAPASIAVIVDFGDGSAVSSVCVPADSTDNGVSVLVARANQVGAPAPRFSSSGLLCAIDGVPDHGCGEPTGSHYAYWSYWHGANGVWTYSNVGPGGSRVQSTTAEGWRFQPQGAGGPSDPPPRGSPDALMTCTPAAPATTAASSSSASTRSASAATNLPGTATSATTAVSMATASTAAPSISTNASALRVTARDPGGGPVWALLAGGGLIAMVGGAGVVVSRRRARDA